jgi:hypothetical protein
VDPDGVGDVTIQGAVVANHTVPIETHSRALNTINVEIQVAAARTGTPGNSLDAGVCSFDDTAFSVDANGYVTLAGGSGPAIDEVNVDANTGPGTDPVLPNASGQITVSGSAVANHSVPIETHSRAANAYNIEVQLASAVAATPANSNDAGVCSFDNSMFTVDANGFVQLSGGGLAVDQIAVDANTGPGTDPVLPAGTGQVTIQGASVAAHSVPIETHSRAANTLNVEVQYASAVSSTSATDSGVCHFNNTLFSVDSNGYVGLTSAALPSMPGVTNLGINYNAGTFTVTSADGTALSSSNVAKVTLQSKSSPGYLVTVDVTADQDFIDDAGSSQIINNLFGLTTGVAWAQDIPFFLYAVLNDSENAIQFMISRSPANTTSPAAANIGAPDDAVADAQRDFWSLENITETEWDQNPCLCVGSFRMQMSSSDDWTVQTLSNADGIGQFHEQTLFVMPEGVQGAASGTFFLADGTDTEPEFASNNMRYTILKSGMVRYQFDGQNADVVGTGTADLQPVLPYAPITVQQAVNFGRHTADSTNVRTMVSGAAAADQVYIAQMYLEGGTDVMTFPDIASGDGLQFDTIYQAF